MSRLTTKNWMPWRQYEPNGNVKDHIANRKQSLSPSSNKSSEFEQNIHRTTSFYFLLSPGSSAPGLKLRRAWFSTNHTQLSMPMMIRTKVGFKKVHFYLNAAYVAITWGMKPTSIHSHLSIQQLCVCTHAIINHYHTITSPIFAILVILLCSCSKPYLLVVG